MAGYHPTQWDPLTQRSAMALPEIDPVAAGGNPVPPHATHDAVTVPWEEDFDLETIVPAANRPNAPDPISRPPHSADAPPQEPTTAMGMAEPEPSRDASAFEFEPPARVDRSARKLSGRWRTMSSNEPVALGPSASPRRPGGLLDERDERSATIDDPRGELRATGLPENRRLAVDGAPRERRDTVVLPPPRTTVPARAKRRANGRQLEIPPDASGAATSDEVPRSARAATSPDPATLEPTILEPTTPELATPEPATPELTTPDPATPEPFAKPACFQAPSPEPVAASRVAKWGAEPVPPTKSAPRAIILSTLDRTMAWNAKPLGEPPRQCDGEVANTEVPSDRIMRHQRIEIATAGEHVAAATTGERLEAPVSSRRTEARLGPADHQQRILTAIGRLIGESGEDVTRKRGLEGTAGAGTVQQ